MDQNILCFIWEPWFKINFNLYAHFLSRGGALWHCHLPRGGALWHGHLNIFPSSSLLSFEIYTSFYFRKGKDKKKDETKNGETAPSAGQKSTALPGVTSINYTNENKKSDKTETDKNDIPPPYSPTKQNSNEPKPKKDEDAKQSLSKAEYNMLLQVKNEAILPQAVKKRPPRNYEEVKDIPKKKTKIEKKTGEVRYKAHHPSSKKRGRSVDKKHSTSNRKKETDKRRNHKVNEKKEQSHRSKKKNEESQNNKKGEERLPRRADKKPLHSTNTELSNKKKNKHDESHKRRHRSHSGGRKRNSEKPKRRSNSVSAKHSKPSSKEVREKHKSYDPKNVKYAPTSRDKSPVKKPQTKKEKQLSTSKSKPEKRERNRAH